MRLLGPDGLAIFETHLSRRLRRIRVDPFLVSVTFADGGDAFAFRLGTEASRRLVAVRLRGEATSTRLVDGRHVADLEGVEAGARLDWHLAPADPA